MHHITITCSTSWKMSPTFKPKFEKPKPENGFTNKTDQQLKKRKGIILRLLSCKGAHKGKLFQTLKKKEQVQKSSPSTTVSQVSTYEKATNQVPDAIAFVDSNLDRKIITDCALIKVIKIIIQIVT